MVKTGLQQTVCFKLNHPKYQLHLRRGPNSYNILSYYVHCRTTDSPWSIFYGGCCTATKTPWCQSQDTTLSTSTLDTESHLDWTNPHPWLLASWWCHERISYLGLPGATCTICSSACSWWQTTGRTKNQILRSS